ncbi:MAG: glucosidase, partial [Daejeonella sp.]
FDDIFTKRIAEANEFYKQISPEIHHKDSEHIRKAAFSGLLWNKQYYNYNIQQWLNGDKYQPEPPQDRKQGRNSNWQNLKADDIISMPDKWEYPWFAAWDLAFQTIAFAEIDLEFAKKQIMLLFTDNYYCSDGRLPAYEWKFNDINPPVQAMAVVEICKTEKRRTGKIDLNFLETMFPLLLKNYQWWVKREDANHNNVFEGGFLGLDNISIFNRSEGIPQGGRLDQADGTAWMALFSLNMLEISLILTERDLKYENDCINFFNQFELIANSLHKISAIWADKNDLDNGFFYDVLHLPDHRKIPLKIRSIAGIIPMLAVSCISNEALKNAPAFKKLLHSYEKKECKYQIIDKEEKSDKIILSLLTPQQLKALLPVLFDENEMLAPGGIRSLSKFYEKGFSINIDSINYSLNYSSAESPNSMYGGNSNWRGPVWMPLNYLIVNTLKSYYEYYDDSLKFTFDTKEINLKKAAEILSGRLTSIFKLQKNGIRAFNGNEKTYQSPEFKDLVLFYEYFDGETSKGLGASHQTGWTALIALLLD